MKLYPLVLALAGAGLAGVNAIPLRVTTVSSTNQVDPAVKFVDNYPTPSVDSKDGLYRIQVIPPVEPRRRPCHSKSNKAMEMANSLRKLFGLESIKPHPAVEYNSIHDHAKFVPPFGSYEAVDVLPPPPVPMEYIENVSAAPVHRHSHHRHHLLRGAPFIKRLSHALMMLGPWEGRAVAFVLGCGIGVMLRMMYALVLVTYRMFRSPVQPDEDDAVQEETDVLFIAAPPEYSKDQKVAL